MSKFINLPLILIITIFLFFALSLLLDDPFVWPDEAIYGDIANNLMLENRMGTDLWKGLIDGIENHAYSLPPVYLCTSAFWFKLFGFNIISLRLLSVVLGVLSLVIFYNIVKKITQTRQSSPDIFISLMITLIFAVDAVLLKTSRLGRPEIEVLVFILGAFFFYLKSLEKKKRKNLFLFLTGLFSGLAVTTHLVAIGTALAFFLALIYENRKHIFSFRKYLYFSSGIFLPILSWLIYLYPNYHYLFEQLNLTAQSRGFVIDWYTTITKLSPYLVRINFAFYLLIDFIFVYFSLNRKNAVNLLLSLIIIFNWIFITLGKLHWYTIYPVTFSYMALAILVAHQFQLPKEKSIYLKRAVWVILPLTIFVLNIFIYYEKFSLLYLTPSSYSQLENILAKAIPPGKTIYLSSVPETYYIFYGKNKLYDFPALPVPLENFKKLINDSDYIVYSGTYTEPTNALFMESYIVANEKHTVTLETPYKLKIIELKDRADRTEVK